MQQKTPKSERTRGRPVDTNQQDLKTQILDTAENLFADHGFSATSIRRIADEASVNPALVHYYFGNKKTLLQTVMERSFEPLGASLLEMKGSPHAGPEQIANLLFSMAAKHPNIPHLITREVLLPGGEMRDFFAENLAPRLGGALPALLEKEKTAGRMREDSDASISAVLIMAVCMFPFIARTLAEPVLGVKYDDAGKAILSQQITALLKEGMAR